MFGRDVCNLYIRNILRSSQKKEGFRRAISGTFLPFCARPSRYRARFQASSFHLDSGNWPGDKAVSNVVCCPSFPDFVVPWRLCGFWLYRNQTFIINHIPGYSLHCCVHFHTILDSRFPQSCTWELKQTSQSISNLFFSGGIITSDRETY